MGQWVDGSDGELVGGRVVDVWMGEWVGRWLSEWVVGCLGDTMGRRVDE